MDTDGGSARRVEAVTRIEEQDRMLFRDCGEEAMQERRDPGPLRTGDQMGMAKRQPAEEGVKRRQSGRERVGARREVRGPAQEGRRRERGEGWG